MFLHPTVRHGTGTTLACLGMPWSTQTDWILRCCLTTGLRSEVIAQMKRLVSNLSTKDCKQSHPQNTCSEESCKPHNQFLRSLHRYPALSPCTTHTVPLMSSTCDVLSSNRCHVPSVLGQPVALFFCFVFWHLRSTHQETGGRNT